MRRVRIAQTARRDLDAIYDYWAKRVSPDIAARLIYSVTDRFSLLAESPGIGRNCDEIAPGVLSFPVGKYLIYYRKPRGPLQILHIFHGARDQARAFTREDPI